MENYLPLILCDACFFFAGDLYKWSIWNSGWTNEIDWKCLEWNLYYLSIAFVWWCFCVGSIRPRLIMPTCVNKMFEIDWTIFVWPLLTWDVIWASLQRRFLAVRWTLKQRVVCLLSVHFRSNVIDWLPVKIFEIDWTMYMV